MGYAQLSSTALAEFYRFALLLTGEPAAAERAMAETVAHLEKQHGDSRREKNEHVWLATRLRKQCLHNHPPEGSSGAPRLVRDEGDSILAIEAYILAQHFHRLPEPERSALALFYIDLFSPEEIASILMITMEQLAELLSKGRALLRSSLDAGPA